MEGDKKPSPRRRGKTAPGGSGPAAEPETVNPQAVEPETKEAAPDPPKKCRYCCEYMHEGAVYCLKCEKFQSTHTQILSSLNVASIISVLPMIALSFAFVSDKVVPKKSEVYSVVSQCASDRVQVLFGNSGNMPAVIVPGKLSVEPDGGKQIFRDLRVADKSIPQVAAAKTTAVDFVLEYNDGVQVGPMPPMREFSGETCKYVMRVGIVDSRNKAQREEKFECPCPE